MLHIETFNLFKLESDAANSIEDRSKNTFKRRKNQRGIRFVDYTASLFTFFTIFLRRLEAQKPDATFTLYKTIKDLSV